MAYLAGGKSAGGEGESGVGTNGSQLDGHIELDLCITRGLRGGGILMLLNSSDLRVDGSLVAQGAGQADLERVLLESTEQDGVRHGIQITSGLGVGEGLIGDDLLQAVQVLDVGGTGSGGGVTQESEDSVLDLEGVVQLEGGIGGTEDGLVRVLLGHLTPSQLVPVLHGITGGGDARQPQQSDFVLHLVV